MKKNILFMFVSSALLSVNVHAAEMEHGHAGHAVADSVIKEQRQMLAKNTEGKGFGPQAPRDIDSVAGNNKRAFNTAPSYTSMNLCNIHFHKNAEHKGGEFSSYAGNGDGHGYLSGYKYSGKLSKAELKPVAQKICPSAHGDMSPGDTIEVHYVHSTAQIQPGLPWVHV